MGYRDRVDPFYNKLFMVFPQLFSCLKTVSMYLKSHSLVSLKRQVNTELDSPHDLNQPSQMFSSREVTLLKEALGKCGAYNDALADIAGDQETSNDGM